MKKFGVSSPIELNPDETKKFFDYVDKNWEAEEESDGSQSEDGWEDPPELDGEPSLITPVEGDDNEDVSTGKVGKKDKGSYQHAYKLALKKYQIHSADELDTPAERKGFTDYVDRLWKKGDIHRDKKKESAVTEAPKSRGQRDRERIKKQKQQQAKQKQKKQAAGQRMAAQAKERKDRERETEARKREREAEAKSKEQENPDTTKTQPAEPSPRPEPSKPEPAKPEPQKPEPQKPDKPEKPEKKKANGKSSSFLQRISKGIDYDTKDTVF